MIQEVKYYTENSYHIFREQLDRIEYLWPLTDAANSMEIQVGQYLRALQITCANQLMRPMTVEMNAYYRESQLSLSIITFMARVRIIYNIVFIKLFSVSKLCSLAHFKTIQNRACRFVLTRSIRGFAASGLKMIYKLLVLVKDSLANEVFYHYFSRKYNDLLRRKLISNNTTEFNPSIFISQIVTAHKSNVTYSKQYHQSHHQNVFITNLNAMHPLLGLLLYIASSDKLSQFVA
ncbi:Hypothetical_protein [Hexamita inflata]|uniref:Hypothetical_protein n=1 Tax=Hexamita inflata TaxID=28002 RepID=A0ABP1HLB6_9EUKA